VVRLSGDLTIQTAAETKAAIMAAFDDGADLDVDLSEITDLDTAGLQILLLARREALSLGVTLSLSGPPTAVREILRTVGITADLSPVPVGEEPRLESATGDPEADDVRR
jgi:anti-anti-sigma factor